MESELFEKIGGITLNYTYYPGEDLYSDGDVEDELLEIARTCPKEEYNRMTAEKKSWPVLYHFSQIRENIISWLPITKEHKVLEIGSGCGALTGILAEMAGSVTCIELSKKRSQINAYKNREYSNVEIQVGNFQDIEPSLSCGEGYDFITLIGVFEYAREYMGGQDPYMEMLKKTARHLKPGGQIIIAIENRIGLKYWSGFGEDHVRTYFEGLEGYPRTTHVRTFSRPGLCQVISRAGDFQTEFYYPFPDYKFPMAVYSDEYLPRRGELGEDFPNYDQERILSFSEGKVIDTLIEDGLLPQFANSFLVVVRPQAQEEPSDREKIVFAKYSNDRTAGFSIRTDILQDSKGNRAVQKVPMHPAAKNHLENLCRWQESLDAVCKAKGFAMNRGRALDNGGIRLEYIQGETLEERLDALLEWGREEEAVSQLKAFVEQVRKMAQEPFEMTERFAQVFGRPVLPKGAKSMPVTDIDFICRNVILGRPDTVIDYEWCFDFPIPVSYLVYRILYYYIYGKGSRTVLEKYQLFSWAGLTGEEVSVYEEMERAFQQYINRAHVPLHEMFEGFGGGRLSLKDMVEHERYYISNHVFQVFFDRGEGFSEADSRLIPMENGVVKGEIDLPGHVAALRLDPGMDPGICRILKLQFVCEGGRELPAKYQANGHCLEPDAIYFACQDPQILIQEMQEGAVKLLVSLEMYPADAYVMEKFLKKIREQETAVENCRRQIRRMENTKVWKAYRAYRELRERNK